MKIYKLALLIALSVGNAYAFPSTKVDILAVVEEKANRVDFYNAKTGATLGGTEVGSLPHEIAISEDKKLAFVSNFGIHDYDQTIGTPGNSISVIDLETFKEKYKLITGDKNAPHGLKIRPEHSNELYVNTEIDNQIIVFDLNTNQVKRRFPVVPETHNFIFSPDGEWLWLMSGKNGVSKLHAETGAIVGQYKSDTSIRGLSYTNNYQKLILSGNNEIIFLDPTSLQVDHKINSLNVDQILYSVVTPNGKYILSPAVWNNEVLVIDTQKEKIIKRIVTGIDPISISISPDSQFAYVTNGRSSHVSKINLHNGILSEIDAQPGTNGIALFSKKIKNVFEQPDIKNNLSLAALVPLTGNDWKDGRNLMLGYEFFRDYVNQHGGIKIGNKSYHLNIHYADTQSDINHLPLLAKEIQYQYPVKAIFDFYSKSLRNNPQIKNISIIPFFTKLNSYSQVDAFLFDDFKNLTGLQKAFTDSLDLNLTEEGLRSYLTVSFLKHSLSKNLYLPMIKDKQSSPGIILLHTSSGVREWDYDWAKLLQERGYSVFIPDSFTPRGYIDRKTIGWDKAYNAQLEDLDYAYQLLINIAGIDAKRVGLMGYSLGGYSVLRAMELDPSSPNKRPPFKLAASFYGHAHRFSQTNFAGKIALLWGDDDDRAPLSGALALIRNAKESDIKLFHYANAKHGFDNSYLPESVEMTDEEGNIYHLGYNKQARYQSINDLINFLYQL
jgi:DNA-binding beta-propeller fold protein YncE/dienelactone hydrolase